MPHLAKGQVLTTMLKKKSSPSGLILTDEMELSDIQMVIAVGPWVKDSVVVGDYAKINLNRFFTPKAKQSLKDGNEYNSAGLEFAIPVETFGGVDYLLIDQGDIQYWWDGSEVK